MPKSALLVIILSSWLIVLTVINYIYLPIFHTDYDYSSTLGTEARIDFGPVGVGLVRVPPPLGILAYIDGLPEEVEGLVVYLDLVESELDPRDVGQVALERSTYLIRINQSSMCTLESGISSTPHCS
jgi:hypothetical protein